MHYNTWWADLQHIIMQLQHYMILVISTHEYLLCAIANIMTHFNPKVYNIYIRYTWNDDL